MGFVTIMPAGDRLIFPAFGAKRYQAQWKGRLAFCGIIRSRMRPDTGGYPGVEKEAAISYKRRDCCLVKRLDLEYLFQNKLSLFLNACFYI